MARRSEGLKLITGIVRAIDNVSKENRNQELHAARNRQKKIQNEMRAVQAELKQLEREQIKQAKANLKEQDVQLKLRLSADKDTAKFLAETESQKYISEHNRLKNLLKEVFYSKSVFNYSTLKDKFFYQIPKPKKPELPLRQIFNFGTVPPNPQDAYYQPAADFLSYFYAPRRIRKAEECKRKFDINYQEWQTRRDACQRKQAEADKEHAALVKSIDSKYESELKKWESNKVNFVTEQENRNNLIDEIASAYMSGNTQEIGNYCEYVLLSSNYPDYFPQKFDIDYQSESKLLVIDYELPSPDSIPTIKSVKYVATSNSLQESHFTKSQILTIYDDLIYQVCLRTVYEIFSSDLIKAIDSIVFNGIVESVNPSTGNHKGACILSMHAQRDTFMLINLAQVDAKACFKGFKGVASSKLHALAAIPPIMRLNRHDDRFTESYGVADNIDNSTNLAAMHWEDFEHLIREIFEKEFSINGGEVKVTQASRDGGVDAIAFDPDPIRGGKIVIQAKRYTNTVGVAAVRDLYGTVLNEGANKGILVTTSDYGPDSYEFANGKPLVLLSGGNLLHLLEKHGHRAKIDIQEARKLGLTHQHVYSPLKAEE